MKKILLVTMLMASVAAQAQKNIFLEQSFWKGNADLATVKAEIEKGNNPSQLNPSSFDPVVLAINNEAPAESILFLLSQKGNDVNKLTHDSRTYIFWSASKGNLPVMEYLVNNGAKLDIHDSKGSSPLLFAASAGQKNTKVYDLLISKGVDLKKDLNYDGANALLVAIANDKDFVLTDYFISKGLALTNKDANGSTAFDYAARSGNIELLNKLIAKGVKYTDNAMITASQAGRGGANTVEVFKYLEGLKIKPTAVGNNGENALFSIVRKPNQDEVVKYFLSKGVDVNQADKEGNTAFIVAAGSKIEPANLELLFNSVKNINQVNNVGNSALTAAVKSGTLESVKFLLGKGADVQVLDKNGDNLVAHLIQSYSQRSAGDFDAKVKALADKGLNVSAQQKNGNTLYHLAVAKNDLDLIKHIATLSIDVNIKNKEGYTALHRAAMVAKNAEILKYLVSMGAKKDFVTEFKETAYDIASENDILIKNKVSIDFLK